MRLSKNGVTGAKPGQGEPRAGARVNPKDAVRRLWDYAGGIHFRRADQITAVKKLIF